MYWGMNDSLNQKGLSIQIILLAFSQSRLSLHSYIRKKKGFFRVPCPGRVGMKIRGQWWHSVLCTQGGASPDHRRPRSRDPRGPLVPQAVVRGQPLVAVFWFWFFFFFLLPLCKLPECKGLNLRSWPLCSKTEQVDILKWISVRVNLDEVRRGGRGGRGEKKAWVAEQKRDWLLRDSRRSQQARAPSCETWGFVLATKASQNVPRKCSSEPASARTTDSVPCQSKAPGKLRVPSLSLQVLKCFQCSSPFYYSCNFSTCSRWKAERPATHKGVPLGDWCRKCGLTRFPL